MLNKIFNENMKAYEAKDLMIKHVITLPDTENLWKAHNTMSRYRIKKIVVVTTQDRIGQKHPIGIVTLKDIIKFLIADKTDRGPVRSSPLYRESMGRLLLLLTKLVTISLLFIDTFSNPAFFKSLSSMMISKSSFLLANVSAVS
jgi:CBS-domain-containing membrane protein